MKCDTVSYLLVPRRNRFFASPTDNRAAGAVVAKVVQVRFGICPANHW